MIAILGTSLEALLAAHACALAGEQFAIFGASHENDGWCGWSPHRIPNTIHQEKPDGFVTLADWGMEPRYRVKAYGELDPGYLRPWGQSVGSKGQAWDLWKLYDSLWSMWSPSFNLMHFHPAEIQSLLDSEDFDLVVSTVPAQGICRTRAGLDLDAPDCRFISRHIKRAPEAMVTYDSGQLVRDGTADRSWYQTATVFGHEYTEWVPHLDPPIPGIQTVTVPVRSNCRCFPSILRLGEQARWVRGVLPWEAFGLMRDILARPKVSS